MHDRKPVKYEKWLGDLWGEEGQRLFWATLEATGCMRDPEACWPWPRKRKNSNPERYGLFQHNKIKMMTHRAALELSLGHPLEHLALHTCDNPPCCNPKHLYDGTAGQNMRDAQARNPNMIANLIRSGSFGSQFGELNNAAILSDAQVDAIRRLVLNGAKQWIVAQACGVSASTISKIVRGETRTRHDSSAGRASSS